VKRASSASATGAQWEALGTSVVLRVTSANALPVARELVERELAAIDRACSRFREDTDLMRVNRAGGRPVRVDALLIEALGVAMRAAQLTEGDVDPTLGGALELAGYDRDWRLLEDAGRESTMSAGMSGESSARPAGEDARAALPPILRARVRKGWQTIELDPERLTVRVPEGISLDLGATAKALAADRAARAVAASIGAGVLVSLGGDIATCGQAPAGGWRVFFTDDHRSDLHVPGQLVSISDGGLATSGTSVRRWRHHGITHHHIISPATQAPVADTWRTVSVAAADCVDANIASTAALVRAGAAPEWLAGLGLPARLVDRAGRVRTLGDWPAQPGCVGASALAPGGPPGGGSSPRDQVAPTSEAAA
jgi:thiamine biosynthesis lipoprotein